ncbi:MAG TPA: hypothetical protein VGY30_10740 [Solirubrobacteraceae bacterium]|nr:hypothetical protein [Solirubrobacteraceae bacterium]
MSKEIDMDYIVYSYEPSLPPNEAPVEICKAYGVVDMTGPKPSSAAACEKLAAEIREQHPTATVMVVPFGAYVSTANQFVVKATGKDSQTGVVDSGYFGPFAAKAEAESAAANLKTIGGGDPRFGDGPGTATEVVEVTATQLAEMHVEALPE